MAMGYFASAFLCVERASVNTFGWNAIFLTHPRRSLLWLRLPQPRWESGVTRARDPECEHKMTLEEEYTLYGRMSGHFVASPRGHLPLVVRQRSDSELFYPLAKQSVSLFFIYILVSSAHPHLLLSCSSRLRLLWWLYLKHLLPLPHSFVSAHSVVEDCLQRHAFVAFVVTSLLRRDWKVWKGGHSTTLEVSYMWV